jgi:hypothetical protein
MAFGKCDNCNSPFDNTNSRVKYCNQCKPLIRQFHITIKFIDLHFKDLHPIYKEELARLVVKRDIRYG